MTSFRLKSIFFGLNLAFRLQIYFLKNLFCGIFEKLTEKSQNKLSDPMKIRTCVLDDEAVFRQLLENYISKVPFLELTAMYSDPFQAIEAINSGSVDLLFIDVEMPGINGIQFLKSLRKKPYVVIISSHPEYAADGFDLEVEDYLVKPFGFDKFLRAANKVNEKNTRIESSNTTTIINNTGSVPDTDYIFVKSDSRYQKIPLSEIVFIEAEKDFVNIHTTSGKKLVLANLSSIESQLPADVFIRVHRSFIVHQNKVEALDNDFIYLDKNKIPIGKTFKDTITERLLNGKVIKR